jgi:hypothetical protein
MTHKHRWEHLPKKLLVVLSAVIIVLMSTATSAQDNCGDGLPCGRIPWSLIVLPPLASPTPAPTLNVQWTPIPSGPTSTPSVITNTPAPIPTFPNGQEINDQVATLQSVWDATAIPVYDASGTPINLDTSYDELGGNAGTFFGYARGLSGISLGRLTPLITFFFLTFVIIITLKMTTFLFPFIATVFGLIRKIIQLILDFIPG